MSGNMNREELVEKIEDIKRAMMFAGPVHYRDLRKHLHRLTAQLKQYDRLQADARREAG